MDLSILSVDPKKKPLINILLPKEEISRSQSPIRLLDAQVKDVNHDDSALQNQLNYAHASKILD